MPRGWEKTESGFRVDYFSEELEAQVRVNQTFSGWSVVVTEPKGTRFLTPKSGVKTKKEALAVAMKFMKSKTKGKPMKRKLVSRRVKKVKRMKFL